MDFVGLKVALVKKVEMQRYIEAHRVADVGVDVVLDVFEHFIKVSGACSTQEACVSISLTHTERQTRGCSCCWHHRCHRHHHRHRHHVTYSCNQPITRLAPQVNKSITYTTSDSITTPCNAIFRQFLPYVTTTRPINRQTTGNDQSYTRVSLITGDAPVTLHR